MPRPAPPRSPPVWRSCRPGPTSLADGLASGAEAIPTYTDAEADTLSTVAADPVELDAQRANEVPATGYALAPYFMTLALWVGALAFYLMFPALKQSCWPETGRHGGSPSAATCRVRSWL